MDDDDPPCTRCGWSPWRHCKVCGGCWGGHTMPCPQRPPHHGANYPQQVYTLASSNG
jgi:hypothetical protein